MGFCFDSIQRSAARSQWICTPGRHVVEIVDYQRSSAERGGSVTFYLRDDQGRQQTVRFSLSIPVLRGGALLRFVVAANNWLAVEHQGGELSVANAKMFRSLVGRRIIVTVVPNNRGHHDVVDYEPLGSAE